VSSSTVSAAPAVSTSTTNTDIFSYERIDARELARRLNLPVSWVRDRVRRRCLDPIPHERHGKYVRFLWGHPRLAAYLEGSQVS
jgi:hypothetical protein